MGKILVMAEKPSVGRDLARVLGCRVNGNGFISGDKYIVTWALGHLVTLADPEMYDKKYQTWRLEDLPMLPDKMQLTVIKETSKQFKTVSSLLHRPDIDKLVIATDAGREGELVARLIMIKAGWRGKTERLWVSSQTDASIKNGFANLKPAAAYDNLYLSAKARSEADWLVGLNVTRALTCKYNAQLAAGRVQTPTLALIVKREEDILKFRPSDYYTVSASFGSFNAVYYDKNNQCRFTDKAKAEALAKACSGKRAVITEVKKEYRHTAPPAAYDLTELQRDANKKYAYSAKQTLSIMQSLYETHKILTYPRTDSRYITADVAATLTERLKAVSIGPYKEAAQKILRSRPIPTKYIVNDAKVTDHHAIIPTEQFVQLSKLTPEERNVYDLVVRRFLAVLSPAFEYEEVKLKISVDKNVFLAKGRTVKSEGWKSLYGSLTDDDEDASSDLRSQRLPSLTQGTPVFVKDCRVINGKTKPPARYTEATLLTAMENPSSQIDDLKLRNIIKTTTGLGTPATRADIIEKLFDSFCIERKGKEIHPTSKGKQLISIVPPDLKSAELTAKWEEQLKLISTGKASEKKFVADMKDYASRLVKSVIASDAKFTHDNVTHEKCPECGKFLLDVQGKRGRMLVCPDRECGYRKSISVTTNARCPNCHKKLEMRGEGDKKTFYCVCGYREKLSDFEKKKTDAGAGKRDVEKYLRAQNSRDNTPKNSALADQLAKWLENN
ncbi:MAG: DNA topoisomerase III [Clostridiales bacterium]|nr:DNA topoisomerase III [Clostridiales bacterium]